VLGPYRRLGYELAGTFTRHRITIDAIPAQPRDLPEVRRYDVGLDTDDVRACYRRFAALHTGPVEPTHDEHWTERILGRDDDESRRAVVVREHGVVSGFLVTGREADPGPLEVAFGLWSEAFVAETEPALRSLLAYVRRFGGLGKWLQWSGPPNDPIALVVDAQSLTVDMHYRWMLRLLDVKGAFERRGWPPIDADVVFAVDDPLFDDNRGPWRLTVRSGAATLERADADVEPIAIGTLSSMFSGYLRAPDAARLGRLRAGNQTVEAFTALFAGPDPWCPFFF
jgi:Sterol carrier protein domain/Acetyltransferase (GNAT) domain